MFLYPHVLAALGLSGIDHFLVYSSCCVVKYCAELVRGEVTLVHHLIGAHPASQFTKHKRNGYPRTFDDRLAAYYLWVADDFT
jgi:hypothetical protein